MSTGKMGRFWQFINLPFTVHLAIGAAIRVLLIIYANFHDKFSEVKYTDIDYHVFTDAARHMVNGESPYKRHTYRYSPIIAFFMTPNIVVHPCFGKLLFSLFDILIAIACKHLVANQLRNKDPNVPSYCAQLWLYNPMSIAISTRGNADSLPCFFIIMSLYFLRAKQLKMQAKCTLAGIFLGLSIHLRLYPLAFSFPMFLSLGGYDTIGNSTSILDGLKQLLPNKRQTTLTLSCILTLFSFTHVLYQMYGYDFLFETYIYHLFRKDTRHNFSVMFYYSYLTMDEMHVDLVKIILQVFEILILIYLSLRYGVRQDSLPFALFCQAVVLVAFNSVMTSQYFIWFLSLLPLVAHCFKITAMKALSLPVTWIASQAVWLYYGYLLEFRNEEVFFNIWIQGVLLFGAHIYVLTQLIRAYRMRYGFGIEQPSGIRKNQ